MFHLREYELSRSPRVFRGMSALQNRTLNRLERLADLTRALVTIRASLRANIAETLLASLITEQGGKDIQHEEHEEILFGPRRRAQW